MGTMLYTSVFESCPAVPGVIFFGEGESSRTAPSERHFQQKYSFGVMISYLLGDDLAPLAYFQRDGQHIRFGTVLRGANSHAPSLRKGGEDEDSGAHSTRPPADSQPRAAIQA